jgi:tetratricopeptide (TPR) repeat protein
MSDKELNNEEVVNNNDTQQSVDTLAKTEEVIIKNKKRITNVLLAVVIVLSVFIFLKKQVWEPNELEAKNLAFEAQALFEKDSFALALPIFEQIVDEYGSTDAGNGALLYLGIIHLNLGSFDDAVTNLKSFSAKGEIFPAMRFGLLADAYSELNDIENSVDNYKKAAKAADSKVLSGLYLKKAGILLEQNNDFATAVSIYEEILEKYFFEENQELTRERDEVIQLLNRAKVNI